MGYSELKKSIISEGVDNLLEYSEHKADFINEILRKASDMKKKVAFVCVHNFAVLKWQKVGPGN